MEKKEPTKFEVVIAGLGGHGLLTVGLTLLEAASTQYEHIHYFASYGPQMRTGECECTVIFSDERIAATGSLRPQAAIVTGADAFKEQAERLRPGGKLFVNTSVIRDKTDRNDIEVFYILASKMAVDIGSTQVSKVILLGAYLEATKALPIEVVEEALARRFTGHRGELLLDLNKKALRVGAKVVTDAQG